MEKKINEHGYQVSTSGALVHRIVCRTAYGRFPWRWHVHHCDGDKANNDPGNLIAIPEELHNKIHHVFGYGSGLPCRRDVAAWLEVWLKKDRGKLQRSMKRYLRGQRKARKPKPPRPIRLQVQFANVRPGYYGPPTVRRPQAPKITFRPAIIVRSQSGEKRVG